MKVYSYRCTRCQYTAPTEFAECPVCKTRYVGFQDVSAPLTEAGESNRKVFCAVLGFLAGAFGGFLGVFLAYAFVFGDDGNVPWYVVITGWIMAVLVFRWVYRAAMRSDFIRRLK